MTHSFEVGVAELVGVNAAILMHHIFFWSEKNRANNKNIHDGRAWTYCSVAAFCMLFPYLTAKQIRGAIEKLKAADLIVTGNFNKISYDRTQWYAPTDFAKSIYQKEKIHLPKKANGFEQKGKPIPDISTDINTDRSTDSGGAALAELAERYQQTIGTYTRPAQEALIAWLADFPPELLCAAMDDAASAGGHSLNYLRAIVKRLYAQNIRTMGDYRREKERHEKSREPPKERQEKDFGAMLDGMTEEEFYNLGAT